MSRRSLSRAEAQRRADQIRAFRAELADSAREGLAPPPADWLDSLARHQDDLLAAAASQFDIDRTLSEKQMSLGMSAAAIFGAGALVAAVVSYFDRVWGTLPAGWQVAAVTAAPLAAVAATILVARRERTLHLASVCAIVACAAFVLQTVMLGQIFNMRGSPHVLAAWAAFALALALAYEFALPFAAAIVALIGYGSALTITTMGGHWSTALQRPESLLLPAAVALVAACRAPESIRAWGRDTALLLLLAPVLILSASGTASLLTWAPDTVELGYQILAVALGIAAIVLGIRHDHSDVFVIGASFLAVFLLLRFVDWWWDWMPRYLFFLLLATLALVWLWLLRVFRRRLSGEAS